MDIPNVQYRDKGSVLVIDALGASQVGVYRCVVHNIVGEDSTNITVDVFGKKLSCGTNWSLLE